MRPSSIVSNSASRRAASIYSVSMVDRVSYREAQGCKWIWCSSRGTRLSRLAKEIALGEVYHRRSRDGRRPLPRLQPDLLEQPLEFASLQNGDEVGVAGTDDQFLQRQGERKIE